MKKIILSVVTAVMFAACNPYGSEIPRSLVGNYISLNDRGWKLGLFEEFAIYQNDFWNYKSVSDNEIVLTKKNGESATLKFSKSEFSKVVETGECNFPALVFNGDTIVNFDMPSKAFLSGISPWYKTFFENIEPDTSQFKKHEYKIDTAVVRLYIRNTAKGMIAFEKRKQNRVHDFTVLNYLEERTISGFPLDSTEHYGYRYEFKIPVTGISELPSCELCDYHHPHWNYCFPSNKNLNFIVEPGDTLMFYAFEDDIPFVSNNASGKIECMGGNARFNAEKNATLGLQDGPYHREINYSDGTKETFDRNLVFAESEVLFSDKFKKIWNLKYGDGGSLLSEDKIFMAVNMFDSVNNTIMASADSLPSTEKNLSLHPDWILCESDSVNTIINPEFITKEMGLSADFVEFYRLMHAVQFYDDFSEPKPFKDFEYQNVINNLSREDYKRYLNDKIKQKERTLYHQNSFSYL